MKKQFLILFAFISVLALSQVPQRFNKVIVTGDITSPKFIKTGSNADSVLLGNGSARSVNSIKTDTVSLSNRINAKATGNGTANGTNTGDETLTSIKTKLGAATSVSDGYLKYQDWSMFNSKEPAIIKNTAFNKNFGTTTGTVLEGRTFGTAANSAVEAFQPIENQRLSTANSPSFNTITSTVAIGTAPLTVNSTTMVGNLNAQFINGTNLSRIISEKEFGNTGLYLQNNTVSWLNSAIDGAGGITSWTGNFLSFGKNDISYKTQFLISKTDFKFRGTYGNEDTQFNTIYHSGNLTNTLTTNYIPKWNGSSFTNSLISDDGSKIFIGSGGTSNQAWEKLSVQAASGTAIGIVCKTGSQGIYLYNAGAGTVKLDAYDWGASLPLDINIGGNGGKVIIPATTPSTAPTNGALVVGGGIGANHVRANNFYGNGSNLTGVQLPITLTTNGTSGAATFSGNVLNVPNYAASGGVNQTQTTVNGSTGGNMVCSMPFQTGSYKKVLIILNDLVGDAVYTLPTPFVAGLTKKVYATQVSVGTTVSYGNSSISVTATLGNGAIIVEGY